MGGKNLKKETYDSIGLRTQRKLEFTEKKSLETQINMS